ncbi:MAG: biotin/lipoyl-binding protein [Clostridia bacterium]|nr:biotin/lipoyl-binding protein [Clostridia bacterium]
MKKTRWLIWLPCLTAAASVLMLAVPWAARMSRPEEKMVEVRACTVELGRVEQTVALMGTIRHTGEYAAICPASGLVAGVNVKPGDRVKAGQALFRLDDRLQAETLAGAVRRREQAAFANDDEQLGAAIRQEAEHMVEQAALQMESMTVRAAEAGVVQQVFVTEQGAAAAGTPGVIVSSGKQEIRCSAVVRDAQQVEAGMLARILSSGENVGMARVQSVGAAEARDGQTLCPVTLEPMEEISLPLGAMVEVEIVCAAADGVPVVPVEAVDGEGCVRWISGGRSYTAPVQVLMKDERLCWVDLQAGVRVIVSGAETAEGQRVREVRP